LCMRLCGGVGCATRMGVPALRFSCVTPSVAPDVAFDTREGDWTAAG
jgi:hypothetical protein